MLMRLNCVIVYCSDMMRSVTFYRDQLGFPVKFQSPERAEFHTGAVTLALHPGKPSSGERWRHGETESAQAHPSFEVVDIGKFYEEKTARGVRFSLPPTVQERGKKLAVLLDPDGLPIAVSEERH